jgi:hypothetical protein
MGVLLTVSYNSLARHVQGVLTDMRSATSRPRPNRYRRRASIALAAVSCLLALAACGSSGPSSSAGTGSGDGLALKFAECMRSHGVPNFPDPGKPVGGPGSGINLQAPGFRSAGQTCDKLTNNPQPQGTPASASQRRAALAVSECMRKHGVPNFPDPTFPSSGGISFQVVGAGNTPQSPAFQRAQKVCFQGKP